MRCTQFFGAIATAVAVLVVTPAAEAERFGALDQLIGRWQGTTQKVDGSPVGTVERTFGYALDGQFLRATTLVVFPADQPGAEVDLRREVMWIGRTAAEAWVAHGFHNEGFLTTETVSASGGQVVFESTSIEGADAGMRLRRTLKLQGDGRLQDTLEMAMPGVGFQVYHEATLEQVSNIP